MTNLIELKKIVEKSAFLYERMGPRFAHESLSNAESQSANERLAEWCQQAARGENAYFKTRLSWDGLDWKTAEQLSGSVHLRDSELPAWATYLEPMLETVSAVRNWPLEQMEKSGEHFPFLSSSDPVPFCHILAPIVEYMTGRLKDVAGAHWDLLSEPAVIELQAYLMRVLSWVMGKTLNLEFSVWRTLPEPEFLTGISAAPGRKLYAGFVRKMCSGDLARLFSDYPVLARFVARSCELWLLYCAGFLRHLSEDNDELKKILNHGFPLGKIRTIRGGLSDRHSLGKTVLQVSFESGVECFYKPRDCKSEKKYNELLAWLNQNGAPLKLRTYALVSRDDHGWAEAVHHSPCSTVEEVRRYFQRAGMLLGLLYALEASDCNYENIISDGENPVLIDTETLLQPRPKSFDTDPWGALEAANRAIYYDSVLRLTFLPRWIARPNGEKMDLSGFGASIGRGYARRKAWSHINSDEMTLTWERTLVGEDMRGVSLCDQRVSASDYVEEIITGFEQIYELLIARRDQLWASGGPFTKMHGFGTRFVVRNTFTYSGVLEKCLAPQYLRDGMDTSICVEVLARRFSHSTEAKPVIWPATAAEHASLLDLDIPRFEAPTDSSSLQIGPGKYIDGYFTEPGATLLRQRFEQLSNEDLDLQKRYIRSSFAYFSDTARFVESPVESADGCEIDTTVFLQQALSIAQQILDKSIRTPDGTVSWITQIYNMDSQFWQLQPMGLYLYDGVCGIGLFLAALERVTGTTDFCDLRDAVLRVLHYFSTNRMRDFLEREGIGAGLGTPSLVYALTRMALLLNQEQLITSATGIAKLITSRQISEDRRLDMIGGTAGCLAVLRTLYKVNPQPWMLDLAVKCGEHLLGTRATTDCGLRSWPTIGGKFLAGFSHGAAGMVYSLSQLYELTSDEQFRKAAVEAQQYEDTLFDAEKQNWPNLLLPLERGGFDFWNSWCHGAPGIGLARLGSSSTLDSTSLRTDIQRALRSAELRELHHSDIPCCGNLGRLDVLVEASQKLGKSECLQRARELGAAVIRRAAENGRYAVGIKNGIYVPSFHQGMAGVGYQLLRLAKPEQLSSALCWE
jgi:type 2 lantibiotic biosynthesis protein LanM